MNDDLAERLDRMERREAERYRTLNHYMLATFDMLQLIGGRLGFGLSAESEKQPHDRRDESN